MPFGKPPVITGLILVSDTLSHKWVHKMQRFRWLCGTKRRGGG